MKKSVLLLTLFLANLLIPSIAVAAQLGLSGLAKILPEWPVTTSEAGVRLILSDCPEEVPQEGILYQDTVKGKVRLFFHHVNAMPEKKRIVMMLFNAGSIPAKVEVSRYGVSGPDMDYLKAGRAIQWDYLEAADPHKIELAPGESALLPSGRPHQALSPQMILTGMIDFSTDQEVRLVVAAIAERGDPAALVAKLAVLAPALDKPHLRGSFAYGDRVLLAKRTYDPGVDGPVAITVGDGVIDKFVAGQDATNGLSVRNEGNYGVVYRVLIPTAGKGKVRCYLNPRGGTYAGWAAVKTKWEYKEVGTPSQSVYFGVATLADFELIAEFPAGESLWVTLSPPGASNLPVRLLLVPVE